MLKFNLRMTLLLGTAVRLVLMPLTAHPFDVYAWYMYCAQVLSQGLDVGGLMASLRPLWLLTLVPVAYVYDFLSSITGFMAVSVAELPAQMNPQYGALFVPDPLFCFLAKTPMLLADIATTIVLYRLVVKFLGVEKAIKASFLLYLNPICIWISAAWGQYEAIPAFFTVLSLYLLVDERTVLSALSLLAATLYKVYPAVFLIPVSIYLFKRVSRESLLRYYVVFFVPMLVYLVMGGVGVVGHLSSFVLGFFSTSTFYGLFGYGLTYWSFSMLFPLDSSVWAPLSSLLMVVLVSISLYHVLRGRFGGALRELSVGTFLMFGAVLLSYRFVGETRVVWLLPFLTLMLVEGVVSERLYSLLSLTAFLYAQKNFPYYLLPVAALNKNILNPLFHVAAPFGHVAQGALLPTPAGAFLLAALGTLFSVLLFTICLRGLREPRLGRISGRTMLAHIGTSS